MSPTNDPLPDDQVHPLLDVAADYRAGHTVAPSGQPLRLGHVREFVGSHACATADERQALGARLPAVLGVPGAGTSRRRCVDDAAAGCDPVYIHDPVSPRRR